MISRKELISLRKRIKKAERDQKQKSIFLMLKPYLHGNIGIYSPIQGEVDVLPFIQKKDFLYFPCVLDKMNMSFFKYTDKGQIGPYYIWEPNRINEIDKKELNVICVPLVGFCGLHRIGYGKGYYDRFLKEVDALKIGLAFDCQEVFDYVPKKEDVAMDLIITESRVIALEGMRT